MNNELKAFLNIVAALALVVSAIVTLWLGGAWLYGQSKVIVAVFAADAARIEGKCQ